MTLSIRAYAKHRGCHHSAVQRAIDSGRLVTSLVYDDAGAPGIADAAAADAEWAANTRSEREPLTSQIARQGGAAPDDEESPLAAARTRYEEAKASLAEIELAERRGQLVLAADVEARLAGAITRCKTKLLALPSRARQQDPTLSSAQLGMFEALIREALEDLAADDAAKEAA